MSSPPAPPPPASSAAPAAGARYALFVLLVVYTVNHVDRQVMHILIEPVRADLQLSDTQIGALVGAAFAIFYTLAGFPLARIADRGNRRNLISIALAVWSAMTVVSGLTRNFGQLMLARVGVGIGEAGCTPPAHSLISDYFPAKRRATALAVYALGVPIGTLFGLAFGGYLADEFGWRKAFFVVGAPGVVLALAVRLTLREPRRGQTDAGAGVEVEPVRDVLRFMWRLKSLRHVLLGAAIQTLTLAGHGAWHASFLIRVHDLSLTQAGVALGLVAGTTGAMGTFGGGWLGDRFAARDVRWYLWWPAIGGIASIPFSCLAYVADSSAVAIALIATSVIGSHLYSAIGHAVSQSLVKPRMRAVMSAIALFAMNIVGFGVGPQLVGALSDAFGGEANIRYALVVVTVGLVWSSVHFVLAARTYEADLEAKHA